MLRSNAVTTAQGTWSAETRFDGPCVADYAARMLRVLALAVVVASAAGCGGALLRTLSEDQAGQLCVQKGGWWHADGGRGGHCERQSANGAPPRKNNQNADHPGSAPPIRATTCRPAVGGLHPVYPGAVRARPLGPADRAAARRHATPQPGARRTPMLTIEPLAVQDPRVPRLRRSPASAPSPRPAPEPRVVARRRHDPRAGRYRAGAGCDA